MPDPRLVPLAPVLCAALLASPARAQETRLWEATLPNQPGDYRYSIAVDSQGFVYVAGSTETAPDDWDFLIVKYDQDGHLVSSFGSGGLLTVGTVGPDELANDLAIDGSDRVYVGGERGAFFPQAGPTNSKVVVVRLLPDGTVDPSFGVSGTAVFDPAPEQAVLDGLTVGGGGDVFATGSTFNPTVAGASGDLLVLRLDAGGALDSSFGSGGVVRWDNAGMIDGGADVCVDPSGDVYVVGGTEGPGPGFDFPKDSADILVLKFSMTGATVTAFGNGGGVFYNGAAGLGEGAESCVVRDGKLYLCGLENTGAASPNENWDAVVLKLDATTGALDASFSGDGVATFDSGNGVEQAFAIAVDSSAQVFVAGVTPNPTSPTADEDVLILKYGAEGALDPGFDGDGVFVAGSGNGSDSGQGISLGGSFFLVAGWGDEVLTSKFGEAPRRSRGGGACGLLGIETVVLLAIAGAVARRRRGR